MSIVVRLPDGLSERLSAAAAERGVSGEDLAAEIIEAHLPTRRSPTRRWPTRRLAFIGMGHSGSGDLSERVKELRREGSAALASDEV